MDDSGSGSMADKAKGTMESAKQEAEKSMQTAADKVEDTADDAMQDSGMDEMADSGTVASDGMAKVDENGAQASGLGYKHDATTVQNSRYASGQQCSNCALWQGGDEEWGGCPLFAGKQVKATGWCSAYAAAG